MFGFSNNFFSGLLPDRLIGTAVLPRDHGQPGAARGREQEEKLQRKGDSAGKEPENQRERERGKKSRLEGSWSRAALQPLTLKLMIYFEGHLIYFDIKSRSYRYFIEGHLISFNLECNSYTILKAN